MVGFVPPQLEHHGSEMLRRGRHHHLADRRAAGEKDVVQGCSSSAVVSGTPPSTTENAAVSRYCGTSLAITSAQAGATSDGLMTAALPPAIAATSGGQRQHDRIIPGADDQAHAERIEADLSAPGRHDQRRTHVQGMHPAPQVVARIGRLVGDVFHVGRVGIDAVAAQVLPQRRTEIVGGARSSARAAHRAGPRAIRCRGSSRRGSISDGGRGGPESRQQPCCGVPKPSGVNGHPSRGLPVLHPRQRVPALGAGGDRLDAELLAPAAGLASPSLPPI